jgi:maltose alpha-D-glucosyltransferase/alpha-amylase
LVSLLTAQHSVADERGRHQLTLDAFGYRWFRVGDWHSLLYRPKV